MNGVSWLGAEKGALGELYGKEQTLCLKPRTSCQAKCSFSLSFFFISLGLGGKRPQPPASCGRSQGVSQSGGILQHVLDLLELSQLDVPGILTGRCPESILTKCLKHLNWFLSTCRFSYTQTSLVLRVHSDTVGRKFILAVAAMVSEGYKRMK